MRANDGPVPSFPSWLTALGISATLSIAASSHRSWSCCIPRLQWSFGHWGVIGTEWEVMGGCGDFYLYYFPYTYQKVPGPWQRLWNLSACVRPLSQHAFTIEIQWYSSYRHPSLGGMTQGPAWGHKWLLMCGLEGEEVVWMLMLPLPSAASSGSTCLEWLWPWWDLYLPCSWAGVFSGVQHGLCSLGNIVFFLLWTSQLFWPGPIPKSCGVFFFFKLYFHCLISATRCLSWKKLIKPLQLIKCCYSHTVLFSPCTSVVSFFTYNPSTSFSFLLLLSCLSLAHFKTFLHLVHLVNENWIANNQINFCVKTGLKGQD